MDRNALDWLFSTAPQALAALVGLIFTGVAFILGAIDKEVARDESRKDIYDEMKREIHDDMKRLYWLAGFSVVMDLALIIVNPVEEGSHFTFRGSFDPYLLIAGVVLLLNIATLIYSLWFIVHVANPGFFKSTVLRLSKNISQGAVETKDFLMEYIEMEKALRGLPIFQTSQEHKPISMMSMVRELQYRQLIEQQDVDKITSIVHLRNLIVHGSDISHVELGILNDVKELKKKIMDLNTRL